MGRLIVTGSRRASEQEVYDALEQAWQDGTLTNLAELEVVQGGCPTGADKAARTWAEDRNLPCLTYQADWDQFGPAAGPRRNRAMARCPNGFLCLAFPLKVGESKGTWGCAREYVEAGLRTIIQGVASQ